MKKLKMPEKAWTAAAIGLSASALSFFLLKDCSVDSYSPRSRSPPAVQALEPLMHPATETAELPFDTPHKVGGVEFEYQRRDYGAEARIRYPISVGSIDTGMRLVRGKTGSLPINESDLKVSITMNRADGQKLNVTVSVERR